jgi:hypothetical protein
LNDTQVLPVRDEIRARTGNALVDVLPLFSSGEDNRIINLTSMVWPLGSVTLINELMQRSTDWVNIRM